MKNYLAMLLSGVMLLGNSMLLPAAAADAAEGTYETLTYQNYGDHIVITGCTGSVNGSSYEVIVPAEIDGVPVTIIGESAFARHTDIYAITLPDTVTVIEDKAFQGTFLFSLQLSQQLSSIGSLAFNKTEGLSTLELPDSLTSIGDSCFSHSSIASLTLPEGITAIPDNAFYNSALESISLPDTLTTIGQTAFGKTMLTELTIPDSVTTIDSGAFYHISSLTSAELSAGLTTLSSSLFADCTHLTTVTIPASITNIGTSVFDNCDALTDVYYGGTQAEWDSVTISNYNDALTAAALHTAADTSTLLGDTNLDLTINIADVIFLNRAILGDVTMADNQRTAADVNADGTVDSSDSLLILKYIVELIASF